jgi:ABC-type sugar transport system ATPase subunit
VIPDRHAPPAGTATRRPLLSVRNLSKSYQGVRALGGLDLDLNPGEIHGLAGLNGAGKSTLIKILAGVEQPTAGDIEVAGRGVVSIGTAEAARRLGIGVVHQDLPLLPNLSAAENMVLGLEGRGVLRPAATRDAERRYQVIAARFPGAPAAGARLADQGLYAWQIVAIIRAVSVNASVLILDEPTSSLSTAERCGLHAMLADLVAGGLAVLYVSHFLDDILEAAARVSVLRDGRLVHCGPASELDESSLLAQMSGEAPAAAAGASSPESGRGPQARRDRPAASGRTGLTVKDLACGRLRPTTLAALPGERLGLFGLEGSGAREVLEAIFGLRQRTGQVEWDGRAVRADVRHAIDCGIALVTGDRSRAVIPGWSVALNYSLPVLSGRPLLSSARRPAGGTAVARSIAKLGIKATPEQSMGTLSGGNQQKVLLGRWADRPRQCLLLDEPTRGVDVAGRAVIHRELIGLADGGATLVVHSTDPEEIVELCDRVLVFADGRIVAEVSSTELSSNRLEQVTRDRSLHRAKHADERQI